MALDIQRMLGQLSPARPIDLGGSSGAREQLRLARERFEFEKQQAQKEKELRLLEEQGRMARERMQQERLAAEEQAKLEAQQQAALLAQQQAALGKAGELAGTGKAQQLAAMSPLMDQLGYDMNSLGSVGGLPVYDFVKRAQAQAAEDQAFEQGPRAIDQLDGGESATQSLRRMAGLGYPTNERGNLEDPGGADRAAMEGEPLGLEPQVGGVDEATADALAPGDADMATAEEFAGEGDVADVSVRGRGLAPASLSTGDAFARALAAQRYALETGKPARAPDEVDYMGAVPRNRIDMPAMAAETLARLKPALDARVMALPDDLRPAARRNADAIGGLGLEATDALAEQDKAMDDAVSIYNSQQNLLAEKEKAQVQREDRSAAQQEQWRSMGIERARHSFQDANIEDSVRVTQAAATVRDLMKKGGKRNHAKAINYLMGLTGNKGAQTEADALRMLGGGQLSTIEQVQDWLHSKIAGGFSPEEIESINAFVDMQLERNEGYVFDWLSQNDRLLRSGRTNRYVREGYEEFRNGGAVPPDLLDRYEALTKKADAANGRSATSAPSGDTEGLDPDKLGRVIGRESGGDAAATSSAGARGTMQIMPDNLRAMGIEPEAFAKLSPAEQMPYNVRYLKERGITKDSSAEDYALAVAAPTFIGKPPETVVYPKDSAAWKENPGWRPADGGDITVGSILKFYGLGGEGAKGAERKADAGNPYANLPEPKTPEEKRVLELLKKRGG